MALINEIPLKIYDSLPTRGLYPGELVSVYTVTRVAGNVTASVTLYYWNAASDAWKTLGNLTDAQTFGAIADNATEKLYISAYRGK